jgi:uncharacterized protein
MAEPGEGNAPVPEPPERITVEVAYARPEAQLILSLEVPVGTTVLEAVRLSGIVERFPEIDPAGAKLGIFGKLTRGDTVLKAKDRVEIYRPLIADPKEVRRQRAAEGKPTRKGGATGQGQESD